jgi:hypothetical protein
MTRLLKMFCESFGKPIPEVDRPYTSDSLRWNNFPVPKALFYSEFSTREVCASVAAVTSTVWATPSMSWIVTRQDLTSIGAGYQIRFLFGIENAVDRRTVEVVLYLVV